MRRVFSLVFALNAALAATAAFAGVDYQVTIVAPEELAEPLRQGLDLERWRKAPDLSPEELRRLANDAVLDARAFAAAEGYFSAQVRVEIDDKATPWRVTLHLEPGTLAVDLQVIGPAAADAEARDLIAETRREWPLRAGEPFRQEDWAAAKEAAVRSLSGWRYAGARIASSEARVDPAVREATLRVVLDSGPAYRVGPLAVTGTERYPAEIVENLNPLRPGDDYDREKLIVYQRRLAGTGYFASVLARIDTEAPDPSAAPLRVAVIEAPAKQFEAGVSYNTDVGARLQLRYSDQDLLGKEWRVRTALSVDAKIQGVQVDFDSPPRENGRYENWFARATHKDIQNEVARTYSMGVAHNYGTDLAPSALILSWTLEESQAGSSDPENNYAVYLGYRRTFRRTDAVVAPRAGYFGSVSIGGAPGFAASQAFLRAQGEMSVFFPFGRKGDLAFRAQAGAVAADAREGIPTPFLYRTGGDQTVRGYAFEAIGVRQGDAIVGGRRLAVASAEYTHWVGEGWGIAGFLDAGDAWDDGERFRAALGYGVGLRLRTPIGPGRLDLAYGEETGEYRLHVSIGYVFQ